MKMKPQGLPSKYSKKVISYYCFECGRSYKLRIGRWWCPCFNPPFELTSMTPREMKRMEKAIHTAFQLLAKGWKGGGQHESNKY